MSKSDGVLFFNILRFTFTIKQGSTTKLKENYPNFVSLFQQFPSRAIFPDAS